MVWRIVENKHHLLSWVQKTFDLREARERKKGGPNSPYVKELQAELREYLKTRPDLQRSQLQSFFKEKGWILIFTPPYTPVLQPIVLQPIELVWAFVKGKVAGRYKIGRTLKRTREQLMDAFYGRENDIQDDDDDDEESEDNGFLKCEATLVKSYIMRSQKFANQFIEEDELLDGTIQNLNLKEDEVSEESLLEEEEELIEEQEQLPEDCRDESDTFFVGSHPQDVEEYREAGLVWSDSDEDEKAEEKEELEEKKEADEKQENS